MPSCSDGAVGDTACLSVPPAHPMRLGLISRIPSPLLEAPTGVFVFFDWAGSTEGMTLNF